MRETFLHLESSSDFGVSLNKKTVGVTDTQLRKTWKCLVLPNQCHIQTLVSSSRNLAGHTIYQMKSWHNSTQRTRRPKMKP